MARQIDREIQKSRKTEEYAASRDEESGKSCILNTSILTRGRMF
jgi:hypothetical protein